MAAKIREKKLHAWLLPAFLLLALGVALMVFTFTAPTAAWRMSTDPI